MLIPVQVEYDYCENIFNKYFNIGFGSPSVYKCSTCASLESRIDVGKNGEKRTELQMQLNVHKVRSNIFYTQLQDNNPRELILSYDCQKNLVLPKIPDQAAYYSRQMYLYNFTISEDHSKSPQTVDSTFSYLWLENEYPKGSNQITSAVYHRLIQTSFNGISKLKLFSDGCGGQNKNKTMIGILNHWFLNEAPTNLETVEIWFPVVGHSFIPPDRIFGNLERQFNQLTIIENPDGYISMVSFKLGEDCLVQDWKNHAEKILKGAGNWHFQFQKSKKLILTKSNNKNIVLVQEGPFYNLEGGVLKSLKKIGKHFKNVCLPTTLAIGSISKQAKLNDIKKLLDLHFGHEWISNESLKFYLNLFSQQGNLTAGVVRDEELEDEMAFGLLDNEDVNNIFV